MNVIARFRAHRAQDAITPLVQGMTRDETIDFVSQLNDLDVLEAAVSHTDPLVRYGAALNVLTSDETLASLALDDDAGVRACAVVNEFTPSEVKLAVAQTDEDEHVLDALAGLPDRGVQLAVAANVYTSDATLEALADEHEALRVVAVANSSATQEMVDAAVVASSEAVREAVASSPCLSEEQRDRLASDESEHVRNSLTYHHGTAAGHKVVAAVNSVADVDRWTASITRAAEHGATSLRDGLHDADARYMASNGVTVAGLLTHLLAEFDTAAGAVITRAMAYQEARTHAQELAVDGATDEQLHRAQDPTWQQAVEVEEAADADTPVERLEELAESASPRVRAQVARNRSTPEELRERLEADDEPGVRGIAASTRRAIESQPVRATRAVRSDDLVR